MDQQILKNMLEKHRRWVLVESDGERANLRSVDLRYADLRSANLSYADLRYANLSYADLRSANLSSADFRSANLSSADLSFANLISADLSYADLRFANLSSADLHSIKDDFFKRLILAKGETIGLLDALMKGNVDGSSYKGECACFIGTIANVRKEDYRELTCDLKPDSNSPTERWFMGISKGQTPQSNSVSEITCEWIKEFAEREKIILPEYKIISSFEFPTAFDH